eukprot:jgi/Ulvmu1/4745/UM020_0029.1
MAQVLGPSTAHNRENRAIEDVYQKKTQLEHILLRPDTYIGSIEHQQQTLWVHDGEKMVSKPVSFVPGLYKIFDEILVNAADNKVRDPTMDTLRVDIDEATGAIKVWNNGSGVPVEMHKKEGVYVPELIFGHLLTSSNYEDTQKKVTGGRNGYGAKLANIFSTEFIIETCDGSREKRYKQVFTNNMSDKTKPKITSCKAKDNWTSVQFKPDFAKFSMDGMDEDTVSLMRKRTYDLAGVLGSTVKVYYNGQRLPIKTFQDYVNLYLGPKDTGAARVYEKNGTRWEIVISPTDGQFQQVSFVNSICTLKGGTHVKLIMDQVCKHLAEAINKKNKNAKVKEFMVRNHLWIFVNCQVENPAFDSQTKETLTLKASSFGSNCELSAKFMDNVGKIGVSESVLALANFKQTNQLKKTDGAKRSRVTGIPKLDDANNAGGRSSDKCTLILTEGDSAKSLAISGLSVVGRDNYGVFPLRGKLLNVREATTAQVNKNAEITALKQIIGLQHGKEYSDVKALRYGKVMIMTDQDQDGSHIKGLIMNYLHHFYPSLLKVPGFLVEFITPIVKATKGHQVKVFYTIPEYEAWKEEVGNLRGWKIKYYKGLGTSTSKEAKEYFAALTSHRKTFVWTGDEDGQSLELAFSKKKVEQRKIWLKDFVPGTFLDHEAEEITYSDFVHRELILFSRADLDRSIPCMLDGLKPGQRKILFACFKRNLKNDVKVAQLSGYVAEHSAYHHGETSLQSTIVGLAQDFVGSNNINLLYPSGQFGTRLQGGKDSASARYIFTRLAPLARHLFNEADDALLEYQTEEGQRIEPKWYLPILPTVLVNGAEGIGTGWSTSIPNYNPLEVVDNIRKMLDGEPMEDMLPWYRNFNGEIREIPAARNATGKSFQISGIVHQDEEGNLEISELPVRKWTQDYKEWLDALVKPADGEGPALVSDFKEHHTDTEVSFTVTLTDVGLRTAQEKGISTFFKLQTKISTSNMMLFNADGLIEKFTTPEHILTDFYSIRLEYYERRRKHLLREAELQLQRISNKVKFILAVVHGELIISGRKRPDIEIDMERMDFDRMPKAEARAKPGAPADADEEAEADAQAQGYSYDYLLSMAISSLTEEKVQALESERDEKDAEVERMRSTTKEDLWKGDLSAFEAAYKEWLVEEEEAAKELRITQRNAQGGQRAKGKGTVAKAKAAAKPAAKAAAKPAAAKAAASRPVAKAQDTKSASASKQPKLASLFAAANATKTTDAGPSNRSDEDGPAPKKASKSAASAGAGKRKIVALGTKAKVDAKKKPQKKALDDSDEDSDIGSLDSDAVETPKKSPKAKIQRMRPSPFHKGSDEPSSSDDNEPPVAIAPARPARARAGKQAYVIEDSEVEDEEDEASDDDYNDGDDSDDDFA